MSDKTPLRDTIEGAARAIASLPKWVQDAARVGTTGPSEPSPVSLVARLRDKNLYPWAWQRRALLDEAADRIEQLQRERDALKAQNGLQRVYQHCPKHVGQSWTGVATVMNLPIIVCPICDPDAIRHTTESKG